MASENIQHATDSSFDELVKGETPVLVDFWAEWCMPCKALGPVIDDVAKTYAGKVKVGKMNTDSSQHVPVKYNIQAIPTVLIFNGGEVAQKFVGLTTKKDLSAALDAALG